MNGKIVFYLLLFLSISLLIRVSIYFIFSHVYKEGEMIEEKITLFSDPKTFGKVQRFSITLPSGQNVLVTVNSSENISYADTVLLRGQLKNKNIGGKNILALDYAQIDVKKGSENPFLAFLGKVRFKISDFYNSFLPQTSSSLLLGIVFGIKENMPKDFQDLLKATGVTHVIAASGMNITLIAGFFALSFGRFFKRRSALVLTLIAISIYAILSGLSPSIVRATIMGMVAFSAQILGRQNSSLFALFMTIFVMVFITPIIIFDVGFELSALSTLGIITINPLLEAKLKGRHLLKILGSNFFTTTSAQIMTVPIILSNFGSYSLLSILVNLLVLWTVPSLMVLGALSAFLAFVLKPLAVVVLYLSYPFLAYFETVVRTFGSLNLSLQIPSLAWQISIGYYLILAGLYLKTR